MVYYFIWTSIGFQEIALDTILFELTTYQYKNGIQVQWVMAFLIPLFRGFNEWLLPKFFKKAAGEENEDAILAMETAVGDVYALYVAVRLSSAEQNTVNWILGVECFINFCYTVQIIWLNKKAKRNHSRIESNKWKHEIRSKIRSLITIETIEILIPLAYSMCYATAYYGPNATLMAGVKSNYFGNTEVTDIDGLFTGLFKIAGIDLCAAMFFA